MYRREGNTDEVQDGNIAVLEGNVVVFYACSYESVLEQLGPRHLAQGAQRALYLHQPVIPAACKPFQLRELCVCRSDQVQQHKNVDPVVVVAAHSSVSEARLLPLGREVAGPVDGVRGGPLVEGLLPVKEDKLEGQVRLLKM